MELVSGADIEIIKKAQTIRKAVFVVEQGIPEDLDLDGLDGHSHHALVTDGADLVGTARVTLDENKHAVLARVAVMKPYRGKGVATMLVKALLDHCEQASAKSAELHAHKHLRAYYEAFGFEFIKPVEVVGGHQLIEMRRDFSGENW